MASYNKGNKRKEKRKLSNKFNKKWLIGLTALLLVATSVLSACSSATTTASTPAFQTASTVTATVTQSPIISTVTTTATTTAPAVTSTITTTTTTATTAALVPLNGAGATFPAPLYTKWFDAYNKLTGVKINYNAIGSGGGITQITNGTVDFGASDGIMTDTQVAAAQAANGPILHIPMTIGPVAIVYSLPYMGTTQLKLTGDVLAKIYLKQITQWNDPAIVASIRV